MRKFLVLLVTLAVGFSFIQSSTFSLNNQSNANQVVNLGFDDDDLPDFINLGFDDDDLPDFINLGFDDDDLPDFINL